MVTQRDWQNLSASGRDATCVVFIFLSIKTYRVVLWTKYSNSVTKGIGWTRFYLLLFSFLKKKTDKYLQLFIDVLTSIID